MHKFHLRMIALLLLAILLILGVAELIRTLIASTNNLKIYTWPTLVVQPTCAIQDYDMTLNWRYSTRKKLQDLIGMWKFKYLAAWWHLIINGTNKNFRAQVARVITVIKILKIPLCWDVISLLAIRGEKISTHHNKHYDKMASLGSGSCMARARASARSQG